VSVVRPRLIALSLALATLALGLGARAVLTGLAAKIAGVALYAVLVYALVLVAAPRLGAARACLTTVVICFAIELFQLTPIPAALGERHVLFRLVLGTTFGPWDLPMYAAGALAAAAIHEQARRR
jgi:hypothetical protein